MTTNPLMELGFIFLHADLTDDKLGLCDIKMKCKYPIKELKEEELKMIELLNVLAKKVDAKRLPIAIKEVQPVLEQTKLKEIRIQRLLMALELVVAHYNVNNMSTRKAEIEKLTEFIMNEMRRNNEPFMMQLIKNTKRMVYALEHYIKKGEVLDVTVGFMEWIRITKKTIQSEEDKELLLNQFAKYMKVSKGRVSNWIKKGWITPNRDSKNRRIFTKRMLYCEFEYA